MINSELILISTKIIEKKLTEKLTIRELSEKIGYSQYHFIRLFNGVVGCSPGEYLQSRRLSCAARDLMHSSDRVVEIALKYQFKSSEAFSRAFKRYTGFSPTMFRKDVSEVTKFKWSKPYSELESIKSKKVCEIEPEIVELDELLLLGLSVKVDKDYSVIRDVWNELFSLSEIKKDIESTEFVQYSFWDNNNKENNFYIMAAKKTDNIDSFSTLLHKRIPGNSYLRFPHFGPCKNIIHTYNWLFSSWLPDTEFRLNKPYSLEIYPNSKELENNKDISAWILLPYS